MADVAVLVGEDLDLDVPRRFEILLDVDGGVVEVCLPLAFRGLELRFDLVGGADHLQPPTAAAALGLDRDGIAVFGGDFLHRVGGVDGLGRPRNHGHLGLLHQRAGLRLLAQFLHRVGGGADPDQFALLDFPGELGVFGQEAVAGVDRVGVGPPPGLDHGLVIQIRVRGAGGADVVRLVGHSDVPGVFVGVAVDRDGPDAEVATRPHHPDGDLPAVSHEHLVEHLSIRSSTRHLYLSVPYELPFDDRRFPARIRPFVGSRFPVSVPVERS
jgi:hypothetical protein